MIEEWRPVPGHPQFEASSLARIRTHDRVIDFVRANGSARKCRLRGRIVSPFLGDHGYLSVSFKVNGKRKKYLLHRLVGMAFVPGFKPGLSINHKNGVKADNRPENLEWVTLAQNTAHQWQIGLVNLRGEDNPHSKLKRAQVIDIKARLKAGEGAISIARDFPVSDSLVYLIAQGKRWASV